MYGISCDGLNDNSIKGAGKTLNEITNSLAALKPVDKQLMRSRISTLVFHAERNRSRNCREHAREQLTTTDNSLHSNVSVYTLNYSIGRHRVSGGSEREILNRSARHQPRIWPWIVMLLRKSVAH